MWIDRARGVSGALLRYTSFLRSNAGKSIRTVYISMLIFPFFTTDSLKTIKCEYMINMKEV